MRNYLKYSLKKFLEKLYRFSLYNRNLWCDSVILIKKNSQIVREFEKVIRFEIQSSEVLLLHAINKIYMANSGNKSNAISSCANINCNRQIKHEIALSILS